MLAVLTPASSAHLLLACLFFSRALASGTFNLFNFAVTEVVEADMLKHNRARSATAMFFSINALFTKPALSLAPSLVVSVLTRYGYNSEDDSHSEHYSAEIQSTVFAIVCWAPLLAAALQLVVWTSMYHLRGAATAPNTAYSPILSSRPHTPDHALEMAPLESKQAV